MIYSTELLASHVNARVCRLIGPFAICHGEGNGVVVDERETLDIAHTVSASPRRPPASLSIAGWRRQPLTIDAFPPSAASEEC